MAFCTNCGANVTGPFCNQCGTPAAASVQPVGAPAAMPQPPAQRRTSPIVWILIVVVGIFVLGFIGVIGTGFFVAHKMHQAGIDTDLMRRNPAAVAARIAAMANKDVDIVNEDDNAGTITLRDHHTGKVTTMKFDDAKNGRFSITAESDDGKQATLQFGGGKLPSWVPTYPGSTPQVTIAATGDGNGGRGEGGNYTFTTSDSPERVVRFFQDKARDLGMQIKMTTTTAESSMVVASDEATQRTLTAIVGGHGGNTTVNVTYGAKR